jgi:hypothetical protein
LLDAFPEGYVVQITRDPTDYVRSAIAWGQYRFAGRMLNVVPYRRLAAPQLRPWSPIERVRWAALGQFERLCWTWTAQNRAMREQGSGNPRFRSIRFEDLIDPELGPQLLGEMFGAIGLGGADVDAVMRAAASSKNESAPRGVKVELTRQQHARLAEVCGAEAAHYGYAT